MHFYISEIQSWEHGPPSIDIVYMVLYTENLANHNNEHSLQLLPDLQHDHGNEMQSVPVTVDDGNYYV